MQRGSIKKLIVGLCVAFTLLSTSNVWAINASLLEEEIFPEGKESVKAEFIKEYQRIVRENIEYATRNNPINYIGTENPLIVYLVKRVRETQVGMCRESSVLLVSVLRDLGFKAHLMKLDTVRIEGYHDIHPMHYFVDTEDWGYIDPFPEGWFMGRLDYDDPVSAEFDYQVHINDSIKLVDAIVGEIGVVANRWFCNGSSTLEKIKLLIDRIAIKDGSPPLLAAQICYLAYRSKQKHIIKNFSFIVPKDYYDRDWMIKLLDNAKQMIDIDLEYNINRTFNMMNLAGRSA